MNINVRQMHFGWIRFGGRRVQAVRRYVCVEIPLRFRKRCISKSDIVRQTRIEQQSAAIGRYKPTEKNGALVTKPVQV